MTRRRFLIFWNLSIAALSIVGRHFSGEVSSFHIFFKCEAVAWALTGVLIWHREPDAMVKIAAAFLRNLTLINMLDEFSQAPGRYEPWEYFAGGVALIEWIVESRAVNRKKVDK